VGVRVITHDEVPDLLPMRECIDVMAETLKAVARGEAVQPLRSLMWLPDKSGLLGLMPAHLGSPACVGIKVVTVMPGNHGTEFDSHQGAVLLFEVEHGSLLAVIDASSITAIRTAAVSGAATALLACEDAGDLAMLGSGVQARTNLEAMRTVRKLRRVRVWSRREESARVFADREGKRQGIAIEAVGSAREAVEGADLVCTTTSAREPVLLGDWLRPGVHINAVGACFPNARELDSAAVAKSRLFVDRRESTLKESGDFLIPKAEGRFGDEHIVGEVGDVLLDRIPGRRSRAEITLFKSLGIAVEDLAAAHRIHHNSIRAHRGVEIDFGGKKC